MSILTIVQLDDATTSAQKTTMKEAAGLIADARGFSRTRRLIDTGDAGNAGEIIFALFVLQWSILSE